MTEITFDKKTHEIVWLPVKQISVIWAGAQRPYDEKWARRIADTFDPDQFDPIKVTLPNGDGIYHAVDGQHRRSAVEILWGGNEKVPCIVVGGADEARAAELFVSTNTSHKRPQPISLFKVRVHARDETAVAVNQIVKGLGYRIGGDHHSEKTILAVAALEGVYRRCGAKILEDALKIIQATWGMDPNAVAAPIIRGYGAFLVEHGGHANWQRLKECIVKKYTPGRLLGAAKTAREVTGGNMTEAVKGVLKNNYNRGLPVGKHLRAKGT